jgi:predicted dehydrogenase
MKILFLGNSNIFQKRIMQAVNKIPNLDYEICSRRTPLNNKKKIFYNNYANAIKTTKAEIVYITLKNKDHFKYAKLSLFHNKHVVVDKPIVLNLNELKILIKLSKLKKKLISESLVFHYHEQFQFLKKYLKKNNLGIIMQFNIPKSNKFNFVEKIRNYENCLYDMLPYAAYIVLQFLEKPKIKAIVKKNEKKLNSDFSICCYSNENNNIFFGNFSHNKEYSNTIKIFSSKSSIILNRFCAPPPNQKMTILYKKKNKEKKIYTSKDSTFKKYLEKCIALIKKKKYSFFYKDLLKQVKLRDKIIKYK